MPHRAKFLDAGIRTATDRVRCTIRALAKSSNYGRIRHQYVVIGQSAITTLRKIGNLNSLLAWGHARAIENLLAKKPECPRALSDKFADARIVERALLQHGQKIRLEQRTKAESDLAVAAASILAREAFIDWLDRRGKTIGAKLGRGVSAQVKEARIAGGG